ncbi:polysaccharide pyruvyl transferase family protein [Alteriqipengyuania flavescens]|uniref:polysaccharide pyruvyl transferase family protein n=1 Tax=Alteriqipengyuania flavescens TaxID=3053610 RepID=UPI0025B2E4C3|nr:polysaccharide pyruvyl transferase family protein [Alteriqipengyuania flavescens]WJY18918.1 polysaccharide pyruvyl transferase family protein [Alteriqipengyuania flavescens]WJY24858.1 polysaccharide pyruvyl transferase family protein [Alteriqipengyuania flavescens]
MYDLSNVYWYRPKRFKIFPQPLNLGDALSPFIVGRCLDKLATAPTGAPRNRLLALGSVLEKARDGDTIWGTGFNGTKPDDAYNFEKLDVRAVRGPRTIELLRSKGIETPDTVGDPGILLPLLLERPAAEKKLGPLIIPQRSDPTRFDRSDRVLQTVGDDFAAFVDAILASDVVLSGSLHGIILAEAYGVPAVFVHHRSAESLDKYCDYYESTGRTDFPVAPDYVAARTVNPPPLPNLGPLQEGLLNAFPADLWLS